MTIYNEQPDKGLTFPYGDGDFPREIITILLENNLTASKL